MIDIFKYTDVNRFTCHLIFMFLLYDIVNRHLNWTKLYIIYQDINLKKNPCPSKYLDICRFK